MPVTLLRGSVRRIEGVESEQPCLLWTQVTRWSRWEHVDQVFAISGLDGLWYLLCKEMAAESLKLKPHRIDLLKQTTKAIYSATYCIWQCYHFKDNAYSFHLFCRFFFYCGKIHIIKCTVLTIFTCGISVALSTFILWIKCIHPQNSSVPFFFQFYFLKSSKRPTTKWRERFFVIIMVYINDYVICKQG